ncbi:hypothetical protein V8G54_024195 [Vigna mungo]|uniref:PB1-like domain-containing protein n=1 Tax=Vigna mungo TaxID=3915 RepID=A0AAQ3N5I6_VIGMU
MEDIKVVIHHGGKFVNDGCLNYEGEIETTYFDPDLWSYFVVVSVVKSLGYDGFKDLWFSVGCGLILDDRLEALIDDVGAMHMVTLAQLNGQVHLYVVHTVSKPDVIHMIEYNVDEGGDEVAPQVNEGGEEVDVEAERIEVDEGDVERTEADEVELQAERIEVDEGHVERTEPNEVEVQGERIKVDEGHVERTKPDEVEVQAERIEVHEADVERTEADAERIEAHDGEGDDLDDVEVEVRD